MTPDGGLELRVGIQSHGQGLETTLAQVAHEVLGMPLDKIRVVHGDTALTPYSTGTWGSRCVVMAGGAVATACRELAERIGAIGAHLLQARSRRSARGRRHRWRPPAARVHDRRGRAHLVSPPAGPAGRVDPGGLEVTAGYKPQRDTGTFSYAAHAAVVQVDTELGEVRILDYVIVEDGGVLVNPMIVDGQVLGGTAQGIGTALYEEMPFDADGQPLAATLADYLLPGATEVPDARIEPHGNAVAVQRVRPEGHRRGRRDRPAGRHRQRGERRAAAARRGDHRAADHARAALLTALMKARVPA